MQQLTDKEITKQWPYVDGQEAYSLAYGACEIYTNEDDPFPLYINTQDSYVVNRFLANGKIEDDEATPRSLFHPWEVTIKEDGSIIRNVPVGIDHFNNPVFEDSECYFVWKTNLKDIYSKKWDEFQNLLSLSDLYLRCSPVFVRQQDLRIWAEEFKAKQPVGTDGFGKPYFFNSILQFYQKSDLTQLITHVNFEGEEKDELFENDECSPIGVDEKDLEKWKADYLAKRRVVKPLPEGLTFGLSSLKNDIVTLELIKEKYTVCVYQGELFKSITIFSNYIECELTETPSKDLKSGDIFFRGQNNNEVDFVLKNKEGNINSSVHNTQYISLENGYIESKYADYCSKVWKVTPKK